jgi:hypothetical protein
VAGTRKAGPVDASEKTPLMTRFRSALVRVTGRKPSALAGLGRAAEIDAFGRSTEPVDDVDAGRDDYVPDADTPWELREDEPPRDESAGRSTRGTGNGRTPGGRAR